LRHGEGYESMGVEHAGMGSVGPLKRQTGITFSDDQLERLLHQEGFSVQRPKHTLKGKRDEAAYEQARQELQDLKKKPWPRRLERC
jgi:hypothetical protein